MLGDHLREASEAIRSRIPATPRVSLVLGSGFSGLIRDLHDPVFLGFAEVPHFPTLSVPGHEGKIIAGALSGVPVIIASGRKHLYEGEGLLPVLFPTLVFRALGCDALVLTNAAGGAHADWQVGDAMLIRDHIDSTFHVHTAPIPGIATASGLEVPADVPPAPYSGRLAELARGVAREEGISLREGVYVFSVGPWYETRAEVAALRSLGGDAFGMSTVPEALVAARVGMDVIAFSAITNLATGIADHAHIHEEVLANAERAVPRLSRIVAGVLERIAAGSVP